MAFIAPIEITPPAFVFEASPRSRVSSPGSNWIQPKTLSEPTEEIKQTPTAPERQQPCYALINGRLEAFASIENKFNALADAWKFDHLGRSVTDYKHFAHLQIIGIGPDAIPFLLRRIVNGESKWVYALKCIASEQVEPQEAYGDASKVLEAWVAWGRRNGYII